MNDREQITEDRSQTISEILCLRVEGAIRSGMSGLSISRKLTDIVDNLLISAYESAINQRAQTENKAEGNKKTENENPGIDLALVAVGGYGRREIAPFSDIDIMLLAKKGDDVTVQAAQSLLYRLWDMGINISHSFRTMNECIEDAMKDIRTRTSLVESRFLAGSETLFNEFKQDIYQKLLFKDKKEFIGGILREIERRHREYGDSVYLLEPNVKEGRGGIRDVHCISWLLKTSLSTTYVRVNEINGLKNLLPSDNYNHFIKAYDFILKTRISLHHISKRRNDILSFEFQDETAKIMGLKDTKWFMASEIFMRLYYKKAKNIMDTLQRIENICSRQYINFFIPVDVKKITDDFYLSKNEITLKDINLLKNTDKIFEAFYIYSTTLKKFSTQVRDTIKNRFLFINQKTRSSKKAIMHFMNILKGNRVYETLREMHDTGILDRFIPEFGRLRHLVIHEPYHRYTVDEHTLIAIRNLERLKNTRHQKLQYLSDIMRKVKQEILFLSILLHDIGKGIPEKHHEDYGYRMLKGIMERFNIANDDRQKIEFLVKNHIVMSKLTLMRDIDAPETIAQLAEIVENIDNLNALYLMTYADMTAVNPHFWTEWKAYLFHEMYVRTSAYLIGLKKQYLDIHDPKIKEFVKNMPDRYLISNTIDAINTDYYLSISKKEKPIISISERQDGTAELIIIANNMPGLFAKIVGSLGRRGLNIFRARLYTGINGLVIDKILISNWKDMWWHGMGEQVKEDIKEAIFQGHDKTFSLHPFTNLPIYRFAPFIEIDNETSIEYTILELFSHDRLGLLYDISMQLYKYGIDIISAIINTEDGVARDVFYLQCKGNKLDAELVIKVLNSIQIVVLQK
ncbi:bifunctional uridylyltransferase/uridylyl-removing enzyme [Dissulfurispira thermophila]|uniref:Bifunctional uridylyltransferase/uridylyl-removing enzyme n=1 Tax=Dissulfurispira thermophila TaxID=2715679 RepID=A0A7G1H0E8_9BACT|nr:[protein-PII] uridylyltransferase [Dissulfurispira thermophila]BCB96260.1 bifunctional uridylyltransferase/uridylyl-removing enzyme [Dissulfurispira thermophila]